MSEHELRQYAADLIFDHARGVEYLTIFEVAEDLLGHEISDEDARKVDQLMIEASITVTVGGIEFEEPEPAAEDDE